MGLVHLIPPYSMMKIGPIKINSSTIIMSTDYYNGSVYPYTPDTFNIIVFYKELL